MENHAPDRILEIRRKRKLQRERRKERINIAAGIDFARRQKLYGDILCSPFCTKIYQGEGIPSFSDAIENTPRFQRLVENYFTLLSAIELAEKDSIGASLVLNEPVELAIDEQFQTTECLIIQPDAQISATITIEPQNLFEAGDFSGIDWTVIEHIEQLPIEIQDQVYSNLDCDTKLLISLKTMNVFAGCTERYSYRKDLWSLSNIKNDENNILNITNPCSCGYLEDCCLEKQQSVSDEDQCSECYGYGIPYNIKVKALARPPLYELKSRCACELLVFKFPWLSRTPQFQDVLRRFGHSPIRDAKNALFLRQF